MQHAGRDLDHWKSDFAKEVGLPLILKGKPEVESTRRPSGPQVLVLYLERPRKSWGVERCGGAL